MIKIEINWNKVIAEELNWRKWDFRTTTILEKPQYPKAELKFKTIYH